MRKELFDKEIPFIIAGPCSAESPRQLREVATALDGSGRVGMIRCGVWKPRTRPGGFEGMGEPALQWIADLKREHEGLQFCCEVARPEHVAMCQQYGIDAVWIGARTSVNPFLVGEIAEALRGSGLGVMVKNPLTPDVNLWLGAIERLQRADVEVIAAIHRGFSTYNNFGYRNNPLWEIPIEMKRRLPTMPLLCDPSHIGGRRELVEPLSQMALDLHFDGLMIECHPAPDQALTDANQQIAPDELCRLLDSLKIRSHDGGTPSDLARLREQLDIIDTQMLKLLGQRMQIAHEIGQLKRQHNMPIFQPRRWQEVLERQVADAQTQGLDAQFVKDLMGKIHGESLRVQESD